MISHHQARRLVDSLAGDPETIAALRTYIAEQSHGPKDWDSLTDREHSVRASNRAVEAISRVATLADDLGKAQARIAALEASTGDLNEIIGELLAMIEARTSS